MTNLSRLLCVSVFYVSILKNSESHTTPDDKLPEFENGKSDKHVLDYLLSPKRYDKRLLPPSYGSSIVNVSVVLFTLSSPDESSLKYEVEFLLEQEWCDSRLRFTNQTSYTMLNGIHHQGEIWLPDTNFHMHGDFKPSQTPVRFTLNVHRDGRVEYTTRRHLVLSCEGSMNIFPFDHPLCTFSMESISHEKSDLKYTWKDDSNMLLKSPYLKTTNAYLERNRTYECASTGSWRGNYSCLQVEMIFSRNRTFYFATIFIPGMILVTSSFITFFLEWNAVPARTIIGVTTMLNYFSTSNSFRRTLPDVANLTAMNVWDGVCMFFVFASFIEFVLVNLTGRKKNKSCGDSVENGGIPKKIPKELKCTKCTQNVCSHSLLLNVPQNVIEKNMKSPNQIHLAEMIDTIARFMFPMAFTMFLTFFFFYYSVNAANRGMLVGTN
ncbi:Gamma-aminobutyric acid A receptor/Glycine receptor alpha,Neurotransmitter-gated ion-channel [Cinara cedri]|uniref:Gamma-aminobutyric acid A receptor/Glycine receptor alpha,Neurotransmitter-gated ion-channel n=1 Tax=Cinara cedri TaxID=506608 RepID=A0A5E4M4Y0_9HEMI|nr:Gamma-aminobutyric acid A receptor/Glycine receptor alpha,Neurotransmitter-gated ion-channel [Cinara cedri]